jgi:hypothetical protein
LVVGVQCLRWTEADGHVAIGANSLCSPCKASQMFRNAHHVLFGCRACCIELPINQRSCLEVPSANWHHLAHHACVGCDSQGRTSTTAQKRFGRTEDAQQRCLAVAPTRALISPSLPNPLIPKQRTSKVRSRAEHICAQNAPAAPSEGALVAPQQSLRADVQH